MKVPGTDLSTLQLQAANKALEAFGLRSREQRQKDLDDARRNYNAIAAVYDSDSILMQQAAEKVKAAQEALNGVFTDTFTKYSQGKALTGELADAYRRLTDEQRELRKDADKTAAVVRDQNQAYHDATLVQLGLGDSLSDVRLRAAFAVLSFQEMEAAVDSGRVGFDKAHTSVLLLGREMDEGGTKAKTLGDGISDMSRRSAEAIKNLPSLIQQSMGSLLTFTGPGITPLQQAFKDLGLTVDQVTGELTKKTVSAFNVVAHDTGTSLSEVKLAWGQASQAINTLAKSDLPAAVQEYEVYIDALRRTGASELQLARETVNLQEMRIRAAQDAGDKISASQFIALDVMKRQLQQQELNVGVVLNRIVSNIERAISQSLSRVTFDAILGGGIVDQKKLDGDLKSAQDAYDALLKQSQDYADQQGKCCRPCTSINRRSDSKSSSKTRISRRKSGRNSRSR